MKKKNFKYCYLCGKVGANSKDHIPPRGIFPNQPKGQLLTVPAHKECNESFQEDDELFRNLVIGASFRTEEGKKAWDEIVLTSFDSNPGARKTMNNLLFRTKIIDPITSMEKEVPAVGMDAKMLERQVQRWTRGLYYKRFKKPLTQDCEIVINKLQPPEFSVIPLMQNFAAKNIKPAWNQVEPNIFIYTFITSNESDDIGFAIYVFYNTEVYLAAINANNQ